MESIVKECVGEAKAEVPTAKRDHRQYSPMKIEYPTPYVDVRPEESYKNGYGQDCDLTFLAVQFINKIVCEKS